MARKTRAVRDTAMLPEYDFSGGVAGKYFEQYQQGASVVLLERDIAEAFPDSASVNRALRVLVDIAAARGKQALKAGRATRKRRSPSRVLATQAFPGISIDPAVRFGKPCIAGTRVDVTTILESLEAGDGIDTVRNSYRLSMEQVQAVLRYAAHLVRLVHGASDGSR